jgi:hypothetical protein
MIDQILHDFFSFISIDKKIITTEDLKRVEITLCNSEFQDIFIELQEFFDEFVYWSVRKLNIKIDQMEKNDRMNFVNN